MRFNCVELPRIPKIIIFYYVIVSYFSSKMFIIGIFSSVTFVFNFKPCIYPRLTNLDPSLPWGRSLESRNHMSSCVTNQKVQLWRKAVWIPVAETVTSLLNYVTSSFFQSRDSVKKGIQFHFSFPLVLGTKWTHPVFLFEEALVVTWRLKQNISRRRKYILFMLHAVEIRQHVLPCYSASRPSSTAASW